MMHERYPIVDVEAWIKDAWNTLRTAACSAPRDNISEEAKDAAIEAARELHDIEWNSEGDYPLESGHFPEMEDFWSFCQSYLKVAKQYEDAILRQDDASKVEPRAFHFKLIVTDDNGHEMIVDQTEDGHPFTLYADHPQAPFNDQLGRLLMTIMEMPVFKKLDTGAREDEKAARGALRKMLAQMKAYHASLERHTAQASEVIRKLKENKITAMYAIPTAEERRRQTAAQVDAPKKYKAEQEAALAKLRAKREGTWVEEAKPEPKPAPVAKKAAPSRRGKGRHPKDIMAEKTGS